MAPCLPTPPPFTSSKRNPPISSFSTCPSFLPTLPSLVSCSARQPCFALLLQGCLTPSRPRLYHLFRSLIAGRLLLRAKLHAPVGEPLTLPLVSIIAVCPPFCRGGRPDAQVPAPPTHLLHHILRLPLYVSATAAWDLRLIPAFHRPLLSMFSLFLQFSWSHSSTAVLQGTE